MHGTIVPGEPLPSPDQRQLREAGFEPGYPIYERNPHGSHVGEVYDILHMVTMHGISLTGSPMMHFGFWLTTASGKAEHQALPVKIRDIRRSWESSGEAYWYLQGRWHPDVAKRSYIDRKCVGRWVIHVRIDQSDAVIQFVPKGGDGANLLAPDGDDFRWGSGSSKTLPPPYRQR
jgi:hypothetical protein